MSNLEVKVAALQDEVALQREFIKVLYDLLIRSMSLMVATGQVLDCVTMLREAAEVTRGKL